VLIQLNLTKEGKKIMSYNDDPFCGATNLFAAISKHNSRRIKFRDMRTRRSKRKGKEHYQSTGFCKH